MSEKIKLDLDEDYIVLSIPSGTVEIEINAVVYHYGELIHITKHLNTVDVREAFKEADYGYIANDAEFKLTEKGKKYAEDKCGVPTFMDVMKESMNGG